MISMRRSCLLHALASLVVLASLATTSAAQSRRVGGEALDREIVTTTRPLGGQQAEAVKAFATDQLDGLESEDLRRILGARDVIIQYTRRPGVTGVFLRAFSDDLVPGIRSILEAKNDDDEFNAIRAENALRILAYLRTPDAAELLVSQCSGTSVTDTGRRLVAAGLVPVAVEAVPQSGLNSGTLTSLAREVSSSLEGENDWLVALEDLRAMNAIATSPGLTQQNRAEVRRMQFDAYEALATRIDSGSTPNDLVKAIYRAMLGLRDRLLDDDVAGDVSNQQIARTLRSMIQKIGDASVRQWAGLQKDQKAYIAYEGTLRIGAQLLSLLEGRPDEKVNALAQPMTNALEDRPDGPGRDKALDQLKSALARLG